MLKQAVFLTSILTVAFSVTACSPAAETADTSPPKPIDLQTRIDSVEKSNMTPDQKKAAVDYIKQGEERTKLAKASSDAAAKSAPAKP